MKSINFYGNMLYVRPSYYLHVRKICSKDLLQTLNFTKKTIFFPVLLAVAIPKLDLFISLFGALCLSALGLAFPALIETCIYYDQKSGAAKQFMIIKNVIIALFGVAGFIIGTYTSLSAIVGEFLK